ncbi:hypothetical protein [Desulfitibacter alkalitolerans]|uniref:hypothetical protein n=1 Tax=Desulfitibacter alkalitolerans TaxID=264641 RepID=UPI0006872219|nr:hypothetical protein [Desulfitibacter alkalitolerans]
MKKHVDYYKLERISSRMAKEFGTIPKGDEEEYSFLLYPMEGNLLKLHRKDSLRNGRHAIDAIHMCLLKIDGYINGIEYDYDRFVTDENKAFLEGLLASFDPFTNQEIFTIANKTYDLNTSGDLKKYFETPVKCLLRIEKSIELWTKEFGVNGYFKFIEEQMGHLVKKDEKMNYALMLKSKDDFEKLGIDTSEIPVQR